jgi:hypothetical protein
MMRVWKKTMPNWDMRTLTIKTAVWTAILLSVGTCPSLLSLHAGEFQFQAGLMYNMGAQDVMDKLDDNFQLTDKFVWPAGLTLSSYYEWDSGWAAGLSVGPAMVVVMEEGDEDNLSYIVPLGADVRYTFLRDRNTAPYVRAGIRIPVVGGDYLRSGKVGAFGAVGVEFWRTRKVQVAVEIGYDSSTVEVVAGPLGGAKRVTYPGFMAGIAVKF